MNCTSCLASVCSSYESILSDVFSLSIFKQDFEIVDITQTTHGKPIEGCIIKEKRNEKI